VTTPEPSSREQRRRKRRARLTLARIDPWSVTKTAFMLSLSVAIVSLVAIAILWVFLSATGVFDEVGGTFGDLFGGSSSTVSLTALLSFTRVLGVALLLAAVEVVLITTLTTLFALLYNLTVGISGGIEVTLAEDARKATTATGEPQAS
jgi:hypothetical protein